MVYGRLSMVIREGVATTAGWASVSAWGAAGLYLAFYAFLLSSEVGAGVRHRLVWDVAAFGVFCASLVGRLIWG